MHRTNRSCVTGLRAVAASLSWLAAAASASSLDYDFDVLLDGKVIGTHGFRVSPGPDDTHTVQSTATMDVRFLGVTLYRYRHRAEERWSGSCLQSIDADTSDDGRRLSVRGARTAHGFRLEQPEGRDIAGHCVSTFAYWDLDQLRRQQELLNPQTGSYDAVSIEAMGEEVLELEGMRQPARRYRLRSGELVMDLWYSPQGQWLQLASTARGNRRLLYRLRY